MLGLLLLIMPWFTNAPEEREMTERMVPAGFQGNYWGPEATEARKRGELPPIVMTAQMKRWDDWGKKVLRDGDIVFRLGDARIARGYFPFSQFLANASNSKFSHTAIVSIEDGEPVTYDISRFSVARQPFCVWMLDNVGNFGVERLKPEYRGAIPKVLEYCHQVFAKQIPFDYELNLDDRALYCVEMTEKAYRHAGIKLSEPIKLGDMERADEHPTAIMGLALASQYFLDDPLTLEKRVFFPGNERHGVWSASQLEVVVPPTFTPGYPYMVDHGVPEIATSTN